jgi:hypothetical protein
MSLKLKAIRRIYADINARDAILAGDRIEGMTVTVINNGSSVVEDFRLEGGIGNGDWVARNFENITTGLEADITNIEADLVSVNELITALDQAVVLIGTWDASLGTFPGESIAQAGFSYIISSGGTVGGIEFVANDRIVAILDNASTTVYAGNWHKLDYTDQVLSVNSQTGAVILDADDISDVTTTNKFNATHTIDVTGATALTIQPEAITNKPAATVASGDLVLVADIDSANALKQVTAQSIADLTTNSIILTGSASLGNINGGQGSLGTVTHNAGRSDYVVMATLRYASGNGKDDNNVTWAITTLGTNTFVISLAEHQGDTQGLTLDYTLVIKKSHVTNSVTLANIP